MIALVRPTEYEELPEVLRGCHATLLCLDAKCRALSRLFILYEVRAVWC